MSHTPLQKAQLVNLLLQLHPPYLILGDLNAKSGTRGEGNADPYDNGRIIDKLLFEEDISLLNYNQPTHYSSQHNTTSLIDLFILSVDCLIDFNLNVLPDLHGSDHYPIQIQLKQPVVIADAPDRFNMDKADWDLR